MTDANDVKIIIERELVYRAEVTPAMYGGMTLAEIVEMESDKETDEIILSDVYEDVEALRVVKSVITIKDKAGNTIDRVELDHEMEDK